MKVEIKHLEKSEVEISVEVSNEVLMAKWPDAVKEIQKLAEVDGFRKGHVPESIVISKFGDMAVLEEAAQMVIQDTYSKILKEHKLDAIGYPQVRITKLAKDNPLAFTLTVAILPEITLPDYKNIAMKALGEKKEVTVTDEEIIATLKEVQQSHAHDAHHKANPDDHNHDHGEIALPELDDAFAQSLGDFKTLEDLKVRVRENLQKEKESRELDKRRLEMFNAISDATKVELPNILVESELDRMVAQLKYDVTQFGGKYEDYLEHIKKTEEMLRLEWKGEAERRAKVQIIMNEIAVKEKLTPSEEEVMAQVAQARSQYKDIDEERLTAYFSQVLQNQSVMTFLEK
jgi:FKBP-type peptidyl-prolyl cis-trans isomerase (trigger factor)